MAKVSHSCHSVHAGVPIRALSPATIEAISLHMDPEKVIPNDEGLPRYWRGLAHIVGLQGDTVSLLTSKTSPTKHVLNMWTSGTIENLKSALQQLDRWDVFDDTSHMMDKDAVNYETLKTGSSPVTSSDINLMLDKQIITVGDVNRFGKGLALPQHYHAYLLHAEEDYEFAAQIVNKIENDFGLKLCVRDRDLVGGLAFQHEAIMRLIKERCNRLIVIVSPNFLRSEANKFFVTFAQALGIDQRQRKVVPCLYKHCELPPELSYYFLLDYTRTSKLWDFWEKLRDSIDTPAIRNQMVKVNEVCASGADEALKKCTEHDSCNVSCSTTDPRAIRSLEVKLKHPAPRSSEFKLKSDGFPEVPKPKSKNFLKRILRKEKLCKET